MPVIPGRLLRNALLIFASSLAARYVGRLVSAYAQGVQFEERGETIGVIVAGIPTRVEVGFRKKHVKNNTITLGIGINVADLCQNVDDGTASRASDQARADVKRDLGCSLGLEIFDQETVIGLGPRSLWRRRGSGLVFASGLQA